MPKEKTNTKNSTKKNTKEKQKNREMGVKDKVLERKMKNA